MKNLLTILFSLILTVSFGQVLELYPDSTVPLKLNEEEEKAQNERLAEAKEVSKKLGNGLDFNDLNADEQQLIKEIDRLDNGYWKILGPGCSWYCGGGPKSVTASSFLESQGANNYKPKNAHDLNYKNAWVEGVAGNGIGEFLTYSFEVGSPRITSILVVNGYVKNASTYQANNRVKKLKVYIHNKPYAILNLSDIRSTQKFNLPSPIGIRNANNFVTLQDQPNWTLKFEILEVYQGDKYDDTVISEIYFDGIDVH